MSLPAMSFPVLGMSNVPEGSLVVFPNEHLMTRCNTSALREGYFNNMVLVDSSGVSYIVRGARKVGPAGPFGGWTLTRGRLIRVELELDPPRRLDLTTIKRLMLEQLDRASGGEDEEYEDGTGWMRTEVKKADSIPALMLPALFKVDNYLERA